VGVNQAIVQNLIKLGHGQNLALYFCTSASSAARGLLAIFAVQVNDVLLAALIQLVPCDGPPQIVRNAGMHRAPSRRCCMDVRSVLR